MAPPFSLKWDRPRCFPPSTFCTAGRPIDTLCTCFLLLICSHAYSASHYTSLFPFMLCLCLWVVPEGASPCSATGLTGDNEPVSSSCRTPLDKTNNCLLLSVSTSVHGPGAAWLYLIMGKWHRAFQTMLSLVTFSWMNTIILRFMLTGSLMGFWNHRGDFKC